MTTQLERIPTALGIDADDLIAPRSEHARPDTSPAIRDDLGAILDVLHRGIEAGHDTVSFETPMPDGRVLGEAVMQAIESVHA